MIRSMILASMLMLGMHANANVNTLNTTVIHPNVLSLVEQAALGPVLDWHVGDTADFNLNGGIISGKMHSAVREGTADGFWVQQDMDLGFVGKQKVEILYDKNTGAVLELLVNGQKQTPPNQNDSEIIETKNDHVTVPKGSFDCFYVKIKDKKSGDITEAWVNPMLVSLGGLIKTIAPSQMGPITVELTDFKKQ